jgi:hypothetical protein
MLLRKLLRSLSAALSPASCPPLAHLRRSKPQTCSYDPATNASLLVTRVGDVDTELLSWYRPEEGGAVPRDAVAVDLNAPSSPGADVAGAAAAGLAAASALFRSTGAAADAAYADALLEKAEAVYSAGRSAIGLSTSADFNLTLLYNASTAFDDLAWGAGWLFKATRKESYLSDVYDFYVKHLEEEGPAADFKHAFDWDNVFWALNVLMAQETGKGTFVEAGERFLRAWICAVNPWSGSLGATANAALLGLMHADVVAAEAPAAARTYRCWALSQVRYALGDAGQSMVVGVGRDPPRRTQDRAAACPAAPAVCNRVTGFLSPDPDAHVLRGALLHGPGFADDLLESRANNAARVGVENNAGWTGALAGAALLDAGAWEVCLQEYGIYRSDPVCGSFVAV